MDASAYISEARHLGKSDRERAKSLFIEAMRLPRDKRLEFVARECQGDSLIRHEVESLLAYTIDVSSPDAPLAGSAEDDDTPTIQGYRLIEKLGEGGMGVVYLGEQLHPIHRRVAIKIIKPGMDSRQLVARFEAEREALALMNHPNVARVFEAGTTERGLPYFVMEYVEGIPITRHCDLNRSSIAERLELFIEVCEAVHHAHQKRVIHRDLKPSNILVAYHEGRPSVKVIDFGVAKAIDRELTERTMFTAHGAVLGTPEYMSPEQAEMSSQGIDTRTDIYSLGVVLYELLTGYLPFDSQFLRSAGIHEIHRIIREVDPPKPSTRLLSGSAGDREKSKSISRARRTDRRSLERRLRSDLDWVVMRCLEKDRGRRYDSASALADDLGRFLRCEPVVAGPPTVGYRARKFMRRHRAGVAVASAVVLSLSLGLAGATWQWKRAEEALGRADASEAQTLDLASELVGAFHEHVAFLPGAMSIRDDWAHLAVEHLQKLQKRCAEDPSLQLTIAKGWDRVGDVRAGWLLPQAGDLEGAILAYEQARQMRLSAQRLSGADEVAVSVGLAESHLRHGMVETKHEGHAAAIEEFNMGRASLDVISEDVRDARWYRTRGNLEAAIATSMWRSDGDRLGAIALARQATENLKFAVRLDQSAATRRDYARGIRFIGELEWAQARLTEDDGERGARLVEAADQFSVAGELLEQLVALSAADIGLRADLADTRYFEAVVLRLLGRPEAAHESLRMVLRQRQYLSESEPADHGALLDLARTHEALSLTLERNLKRSEEAVLEAGRGLEICSKLLAERPANPDYQRVRIGLWGRQAEALGTLERWKNLVSVADRMLAAADAWDSQFETGVWASDRVAEAAGFWVLGYKALLDAGDIAEEDGHAMLARIDSILARWGDAKRVERASNKLGRTRELLDAAARASD